MPGHERLVTAEEFAGIPNDDYHHELVEGYVVRVSPPGSRHAVLTVRMAMLLGHYAEAHQLGAVMAMAGFKIATDPDTYGSRTSPSFTALASPRPEDRTATGPVPLTWPSRSDHPATDRRKSARRSTTTSPAASVSSGFWIRSRRP